MKKQELHPRTAIINKTQKNQSKKSRSEALLWLAAHFPLAFDNSLCIRPLKIGIMNEILEHADKAAEFNISKSKLREAVVLFTRRLDYLACLKSREMRIDLQGNACAQVTEEEAEHAATKIKKRVEKSLRNARKLTQESFPQRGNPYQQQSHTAYASKATNTASPMSEDYLPIYPPRAPASYSAQNNSVPASTVLIKHKTTKKQFDPGAVARLKEKLGLSKRPAQECVD